MQKNVKKILTFIVIVLLVTICAIIVNKKTEFKIFGAKEVHAEGELGSGTHIQVSQTEYTIEQGEELEFEVTVDTTGLTPEQIQSAEVRVLYDDSEDIVEDIDDDFSDSIVKVIGANPGTVEVEIALYGGLGVRSVWSKCTYKYNSRSGFSTTSVHN